MDEVECGNKEAEIVAGKENTQKKRSRTTSSATAITSELGLFNTQRPHTDGIKT